MQEIYLKILDEKIKKIAQNLHQQKKCIDDIQAQQDNLLQLIHKTETVSQFNNIAFHQNTADYLKYERSRIIFFEEKKQEEIQKYQKIQSTLRHLYSHCKKFELSWEKIKEKE